MVSVDEKERDIEYRDHVVKVVLRKVATGDDAIHIPKALFAEGAVNPGVYPIAQCKDFHLPFIIPILEYNRKAPSLEINRVLQGFFFWRTRMRRNEQGQ